MNKKFENFLRSTIYLKDIKCLFCNAELGKDSKYCVCDDCLNKLPFLTGKICAKCGEPIQSLAEYCMRCKKGVDRGFDKARSAFVYGGEVRNAVINFKYNGKKYYAEYLSAFIYDVFKRNNFEADVVVPAPMSENSLKKRGFNQAELLCEYFKINGFDVNTNCLQKCKETENQAKLDYKARQTNLDGAFKVVDKNAIKNKNVLLVDDIFTTGATCTEIANTLKSAGAKEVNVVTLCHEMPPDQKN